MLSAGRLALAAALRTGSPLSGPSRLAAVQACALSAQTVTEWHWLKERGIEVNPCNSKLHPAVLCGAFDVAEGAQEMSVQEAYTPNNACYGCGPAAVEEALHLRSFRAENGLIAKTTVAQKFQAFPGIINGGIISTLFDCHGNWTAAVALMDKLRLPRPPLTLTAELLVQFIEPTPPNQELTLSSKVVDISTYGEDSSRKESVEVSLLLSQVSEDGKATQLARASGIFKKMGALRAI